MAKLDRARKAMVSDRGPITFFATFQRDRALGGWDLLLAASWLNPDEFSSLEYVYGRLREVLTPEEMTKVSRVVLIDPLNPSLAPFMPSRGSPSPGLKRLRNFVFAGVPIKRAYILTDTGLLQPSAPQRVRKVRPAVRGDATSGQPQT